jgi:Skp family chaperone for outer membrane proteins
MTVGAMEDLAKEMKIDPKKISLHYNNYVLRMMQRGVLVDLDIGWVRGQAKVSEDELGIKMSDKEQDYVSLGHQKVLPPDLIKEAEREESRGRAALEKHTVQLVLGRFLPVTASESYLAADEEHKKNFMAVRDKLVATYDPMVRQLRQDFRDRAKTVRDRLEVATGPMDESQRPLWLEQYINKLIARIPTKESIQKSFYWETRFSFVPLPSSIHEEALKQKKIAAEQDALHFETENLKDQKRRLNEKVMEGLRRSQEEAQKQSESFLNETVLSLRKVMVDTCSKAAETMARNDGRVLGSTVKSLENLISRVKMLNFCNDQEVAKLNEELSKHVHVDPKKRSPKSLKDVMKRIELALGKSVRSVVTERERKDEVARIIGKDFMAMAREVE